MRYFIKDNGTSLLTVKYYGICWWCKKVDGSNILDCGHYDHYIQQGSSVYSMGTFQDQLNTQLDNGYKEILPVGIRE